MKKVILSAIVVLCFSASTFAQSQTYKAFKVDLGMLYAIPGGDGVKAGIGFHLEPKYNVTDNIAAGLRLEWAIMAAASESSASISAMGSYLATGDYYFGTESVRPFVGAGVGIYNLGSVEINDQAQGGIDAGTKFGFAPRAGLLLGHFRLGLEYNVITGIADGMSSRNYTSVKLGFEIGGGKK